jgi:polysaccharide chain length determinant protein (PEP-CTERM system associated)
MQQILSQILLEVRSAWRFRWFGAAAAWGLCVLGWLWVALQPNVYEANAVVFVDASSVLRPFLSDRIVASDVGSQLGYVREALLGREHLERVVRENDLDVAAASTDELERLLGTVRETIKINSSQAVGAVNSIYNITYQHTDRSTAVGVVRTLLNSLVEDTLGANKEGTDTAEKFLDERILEYETRLQRAEQALADFRRANAGRLPNSAGGYFERLQAQRDELNATERKLRLAEARRDSLSSQLIGESPVLPLAFGAAGISSRDAAASSVDARIEEYEAKLDELLLQFTEKHPDVVGIRETISRLELQRQEELMRLPTIAGGGAEENPVHQEIQMRLNEADVEIASLSADVAEQTAALNELQALVDEVPKVEAEFARLNRDYDVIYDQYQALVQSRETQALTRKALDADQVEFRVINPPLASSEPVAPRRVFLNAFVFVLGLAGGGGLCYLLAQLRPVFGEIRTLRQIVAFPVLGAISELRDDRILRRRKLATVYFGACVLALTLVFAGTMIFEVTGEGVRAALGSM